MKYYLPHSTACFVCGIENPVGLKHKFFVENDIVKCDVFIPVNYGGYKNVIHGGIITALMDETMGWSVFVRSKSKYLFFTRELTIKFKKNAPVETELQIIATFVEERRNIGFATGKLVDFEDNVYATAKGSFVGIPPEKSEETLNYLIFDDDKIYHKKSIELLKI
jgi:acyl-coenzyme A thioesterase PaaI-like protein